MSDFRDTKIETIDGAVYVRYWPEHGEVCIGLAHNRREDNPDLGVRLSKSALRRLLERLTEVQRARVVRVAR